MLEGMVSGGETFLLARSFIHVSGRRSHRADALFGNSEMMAFHPNTVPEQHIALNKS
jgi:hypothetical protein